MICLPPLFEVVIRSDGLVNLFADRIPIPPRGGGGWTLEEAEHVADRLDYYSRYMPHDGVDEETR